MSSVDILLATYNGAKYLPEQLASLEAQTHTDWRLIVRDDGSSDGSLDMIREWASETRRDLVVLEDGDVRIGPAQSFGRLLGRSDAPYFAFCDQDDVWAAEKIASLIFVIEKSGDAIALAHCDLSVVDCDLSPIFYSFWEQQRTDIGLRSGASRHKKTIIFQNPVTGCAMIGNAALREAMLPLPEGLLMHDWWASLVAAFRGHLLVVELPLVKYRQHGQNSVGARTRTLSDMVRRLSSEPAAAIEHTQDIFDKLARQAAIVLDRLGAFMTIEERRFTQDFSEIRNGLRCKAGLRLFFWAIFVQRRWPLLGYLTISTFKRSKDRTGTADRNAL